MKFERSDSVTVYFVVHWIDPDGTEKSKELGPWKGSGTDEEFILTDEGIPDGVTVCGVMSTLVLLQLI